MPSDETFLCLIFSRTVFKVTTRTAKKICPVVESAIWLCRVRLPAGLASNDQRHCEGSPRVDKPPLWWPVVFLIRTNHISKGRDTPRPAWVHFEGFQVKSGNVISENWVHLVQVQDQLSVLLVLLIAPFRWSKEMEADKKVLVAS